MLLGYNGHMNTSPPHAGYHAKIQELASYAVSDHKKWAASVDQLIEAYPENIGETGRSMAQWIQNTGETEKQRNVSLWFYLARIWENLLEYHQNNPIEPILMEVGRVMVADSNDPLDALRAAHNQIIRADLADLGLDILFNLAKEIDHEDGEQRLCRALLDTEMKKALITDSFLPSMKKLAIRISHHSSIDTTDGNVPIIHALIKRVFTHVSLFNPAIIPSELDRFNMVLDSVLEMGVSINEKDEIDGYSPLALLLSTYGYYTPASRQIFDTLIERGADPMDVQIGDLENEVLQNIPIKQAQNRIKLGNIARKHDFSTPRIHKM